MQWYCLWGFAANNACSIVRHTHFCVMLTTLVEKAIAHRNIMNIKISEKGTNWDKMLKEGHAKFPIHYFTTILQTEGHMVKSLSLLPQKRDVPND